MVVDEFTSSLDRTVAKTTSAALSRLLRSFGPHGPRFVAVTCHDDILPWLAPDWILRLGGNATTPRLTRQRPAQPSIELAVDRLPQAAWKDFAAHHYLAGRMAASATCYGAWWDGDIPWRAGGVSLPVSERVEGTQRYRGTHVHCF